jgi:Tol biopolymer transport system component
MNADTVVDHRIRRLLREALDLEAGPDPRWAESPAAQRVAQLQPSAGRHRSLRALAVAAMIGAATGALLLGGGLRPTPSPGANGWIAFAALGTSRDSGDSDIWLVALDEKPRRIVGTETDRIEQLCPAFSPDGRRLAYGQIQDEVASLAVVDVGVDGSVTGPIAFEVGADLPAPCPVWSPDGGDIAFAVNLTSPVNPRTGAAGSEVRIVTLSDGRTTVLPDLLATDLEWSPDGSLLAVSSGVDGVSRGEVLQDGRIRLFDLAAGTNHTLEATLGAVHLTWSRDGTRIAYLTDSDGATNTSLRVVDVATGRDTVLDAGFGTLHGTGTTWSPDGAYLLFRAWIRREASDQGPRSVLAVVPVAGEGPVILLADGLDLGILGYDGYDESTFVPIQAWGRRPAD